MATLDPLARMAFPGRLALTAATAMLATLVPRACVGKKEPEALPAALASLASAALTVTMALTAPTVSRATEGLLDAMATAVWPDHEAVLGPLETRARLDRMALLDVAVAMAL